MMEMGEISSESRSDVRKLGYEEISVKDCTISKKTRASPLWTSKSSMNDSSRASKTASFLMRYTSLLPKDTNPMVVDMGAGYQALKISLPNYVHYSPVDFVERIENSGASLCNLNDLLFPFFSKKKISPGVDCNRLI